MVRAEQTTMYKHLEGTASIKQYLKGTNLIGFGLGYIPGPRISSLVDDRISSDIDYRKA